MTTVKSRFTDYHSTVAQFTFSESHFVLLLYLTSLNKGSKNPTGQLQKRRRFQNFSCFAKGFQCGAISSIAHKLASNKGPLVARGMKRLKENVQILQGLGTTKFMNLIG